jgi:hypothetical protein
MNFGYKPTGGGCYDGTGDLKGRMFIKRNSKREYVVIIDGTPHKMEGGNVGFDHADAIIQRVLGL